MLMRDAVGAQFRRHRQQQNRTLREVARQAHIALGYLSELERGVKEGSSETLAGVATALGVPLPTIMTEAAQYMMFQQYPYTRRHLLLAA